MISKNWPKLFCSEPIENIENYEEAVNDKEHMWDCHHRAEILPCGVFTPKQLQKHGLYWHRPACELIFLTSSAHRRLHNLHSSEETNRKRSDAQRGKHMSHDTRRKMSESHKGKPPGNKGKTSWSKGKHFSDEHRRKIAESLRRWFAERKRNGGAI